jgi:hypothetical protein
MLEAALYAALCCALLSALAGNRTALVLLASVAFCLVLGEVGVAFQPVLWMMFDLVAVILIVRRDMTAADCVVIALFIPAWIFYLFPAADRYAGSVLITVVQLLLTAPFHKTPSVPPRIRAWLRRDDYFDRLAAHVRLAGV